MLTLQDFFFVAFCWVTDIIYLLTFILSTLHRSKFNLFTFLFYRYSRYNFVDTLKRGLIAVLHEGQRDLQKKKK
jgi:hypothetical protein